MFEKAKFYLFKTGTRIAFMRNIIGHCDRYDLATLGIQVQVEELRTIYELCNKLFMFLNKSQFTAFLKQSDTKRDRYINCIRTLCKAMAMHFDPAIVHAAERLLEEIDKYGDAIDKMAYSNETTVLENVCTDLLENEELRGYSDLIQVTPVAQKLKEENDQFFQWYQERQHQDGAKETAKVAEKLVEAESAYQDLLDRIFAHCIINDKTAYLPLVKDINATIDEYNTNEVMRQTVSNETSDETETEELKGEV